MKKTAYLEMFKEGNEHWIGCLESLMYHFDEEIAAYDPNDDAVSIDGLFDKAINTLQGLNVRGINIPLEGGEYVCGFVGSIRKRPFLSYGIGHPLASAESVLIVNERDKVWFEKMFNLLNEE